MDRQVQDPRSASGISAQPDAHIDGLSLVSLLTGKADALGRDALFWHYPHYHKTRPYGAVRQGNLKLIEFFENGKLELYDLESDPKESRDLAESQPEKAKGRRNRSMFGAGRNLGHARPSACSGTKSGGAEGGGAVAVGIA